MIYSSDIIRLLGESHERREGSRVKDAPPAGAKDCTIGKGVKPADLPPIVDNVLLHASNLGSNGQPLSPTNQGGSVVIGTPPH